MVANVAIDPRGVRPVRFDGDDVKSVLFDEAPRDRRARPVELRRAVCRLAEKDDLCVGETVKKWSEISSFIRLRHRFAKSANNRGRFICALGAQ